MMVFVCSCFSIGFTVLLLSTTLIHFIMNTTPACIPIVLPLPSLSVWSCPGDTGSSGGAGNCVLVYSARHICMRDT